MDRPPLSEVAERRTSLSEPTREVMNAREAADFLRLSENAFKKLAPSLPRYQIYERSGFRYLRSDLLAWLVARRVSHGNPGGNPTRAACPQAQTGDVRERVKRLV